jgi:hypothetical protein
MSLSAGGPHDCCAFACASCCVSYLDSGCWLAAWQLSAIKHTQQHWYVLHAHIVGECSQHGLVCIDESDDALLAGFMLQCRSSRTTHDCHI